MKLKINPWLKLLRLPNLFSVPGDVLAGAMLASITINDLPSLVPIIIISLFLYATGLLLNDYCDLKIDQIERPDRPLPSGEVTPRAILACSIALIVLSFLLAFLTGRSNVLLWVAVLALLIYAYNAFARRIAFVGFLVMGLCRGCNVLLGASIGINYLGAPVLLGAGIEVLYIIAVSAVAYNETKTTITELGLLGWTPLLALIPLVFLLWLSPGASFLSGAAVLLLLSWVFYLIKSKTQIPELVGGLIQGLIPFQACLILIAGALDLNKILFVFSLLFFFIGTKQAAKYFYGS